MSCLSVAIAAVIGIVVAAHLACRLTSVFGRIRMAKDLLLTGAFS